MISGIEKNTGRILCLILLSLFQWNGTASGDTEIRISADRQLEFAEEYLEAGEYEKAVIEYERFIRFFPSDPRINQTIYATGTAYYEAGRYRDAIEAFSRLTEKYDSEAPHSPDDIETRAWFRISEAFVQQKAPGQAITHLLNLVTITESADIRDEAAYRVGWYYMDNGEWAQAASRFGQIRPEKREHYRLKELSEAFSRIDRIPRKNPVLAGAFSVVPGGGFLYCGRYRDALTSFLFNGALMLGAYRAFEDDNPALGAVVSFVELGFYSGNFYGAISSAHKYNRDRNRDFVEKLKHDTRINLLTSKENNSVALALTLRF